MCVRVVVHVYEREQLLVWTPPDPQSGLRANCGGGGGGSPSTGGLQSPCVPQAIQDPAILQHPEADLSRVGEGPARGLEESEVGCPGPLHPLPIPRDEAGVSPSLPSAPDSYHLPYPPGFQIDPLCYISHDICLILLGRQLMGWSSIGLSRCRT